MIILVTMNKTIQISIRFKEFTILYKRSFYGFSLCLSCNLMKKFNLKVNPLGLAIYNGYLYVEADGNKLHIRTNNGETVLVNVKIESLQCHLIHLIK